MTDSDSEPSTTTFADLGLRPELLAALDRLGHTEPTPIQADAIVPLCAGADALGQAATGTGKTAAFALPMLQRMGGGRGSGAPAGLVLVPTRELALQVADAIRDYGRELGTRVLSVYGGQPIIGQLKALQRGVDVVVATPGRALDHLNRGTMSFDELAVVVLDEADEMLDMGFAEDLEVILDHAPAERQTVLFSATMPPRIERIGRRHMRDPQRILAARSESREEEAARVRESAYVVARHQRSAALGRILAMEEPTAALIFCRTRAEVDEITERLAGRGHRAEALHGGLSQEQRSRVVERMRAGSVTLVVATDVAARGLDIDLLTHVINLDVPSSPEVYVHRAGRVGRAGRMGVVITIVHPRDQRALANIERMASRKIRIAAVPQPADLAARRRRALAGRIAASVGAGAPPQGRRLAQDLATELDPMAIAAAALSLAETALWPPSDEDGIDIPPMPVPPARDKRRRNARPSERRSPRGERPQRGPGGATGQVFVGAGRSAGVRPQDLVGAITGESSLSGRDIGAIKIHDRFALVEVPKPRVDEVVRALRGTTIKGRKATVRPEGAGGRERA